MESASFIEIKLTELENAVEEAWENSKVPFLFDQTGNASTFFHYKERLVECYKGVVQVAMGAADVASVVDSWRANFVSSMRYGDTCVFHMDKTAPDFLTQYNSDMFPVPTIFCKELISREEFYMKMLKPEENVNRFGDKG